jgi:hypothetical protein
LERGRAVDEDVPECEGVGGVMLVGG